MKDKKPREFWIHKQVFSDHIFENFEQVKSCDLQDAAIHVREVLEPSPRQDEFDEKAARRGYVEHFDNHPLDSRLRDPESAWAVACRWQFNQMKRAPVAAEEYFSQFKAQDSEECIMPKNRDEIEGKVVVNEDAERDRLEELAQKRAERCWPKNMVRQFETRCDFREGWHAYAEHFARPVRSVKDASAEELMGNPKVAALVAKLEEIKLFQCRCGDRNVNASSPNFFRDCDSCENIDPILAAFKGEK